MNRTLKVLVSSINFAPDHSGIAVYSTDFPVYLAEQGDEVSMVTAFPYYPKWKKREADRGKLFARERFKGIAVYRGYFYVPLRVFAMTRLLHELSFAFFAFLNFLRAGRPDVIVLFTPPFFLGAVGILAGWIWRRPVVINVQDLPIDAALALGMVRRTWAARIMQAIEGWTYRRATLAISISPVMIDALRKKRVREERLMLVPNWIDVGAAGQAAAKGGFLATQPHAQGKFCLAYAGNLGIKQGIDVLLRLAKAVEADEHIHIFIIGDGADKQRLLKIAAGLCVKNVTFLPLMNPKEYQAMLADVDAIFVAQRSGAGDNFFPSKLLGLMAQGKPLLVAADAHSELSQVIKHAGCGLVSSYDDIAELAANLHRMQGLGPELQSLGDRGKIEVQRFDRATVLDGWRRRLIELAAGKSSAVLSRTAGQR